MRVRLTAAFCLAAAVTAAGCGGVIDPSKNTDETFTGIVEVGGVGPSHVFSSKSGEFDIRVTSLTPPVQYIGVGYGQPRGNDCAVINANVLSQVNRSALLGRINSGQYCAFVYDSNLGLVVEPTAYTLVVSHP